MKFTIRVAALLAGVLLAACGTNEDSPADAPSIDPVAYPSVDDGFLSAVDWRFVGPYRGGRVLAVAGGLARLGARAINALES